MNDPLDTTLRDAFQTRHVPHDIRPSLVDVRWRARRRHARRNAALVGCAAVTGAGAVAVLASRHPAERAGLTAGVGSPVGDAGAPPTTMLCLATTTLPPPTASDGGSGTYTILEGDVPFVVATKFGITPEELDAANAGVAGYDTFYVGLQITIPGTLSPTSTSTTLMPGSTSTFAPPAFDPCFPSGGWTWHCTDAVGVDEFGRQVFLSCEQEPGQVFDTTVVPTTGPVPDFSTTTTGVASIVESTAFNTIPGSASTPPDTLPPVSISVAEAAGTTTTQSP